MHWLGSESDSVRRDPQPARVFMSTAGPSRMRKYVVFVFKILVTTALLSWILLSLEPAKIRHTLSGLEKERIAALILLHWITQAITAQRWRVIAGSMGLAGSYGTFLRMHFAGMFFSIGLPSLVGGDALKAYAASRRAGRPFSAGIASVLQDRAVGLIVLLAYGTAAVSLRPLAWRGVPLLLAYGALWLAASALFWLVLRSQGLAISWLDSPSNVALRRRLQRLTEFHRALTVTNLSSGGIVQVLLLSLCNSALVIFIVRQICLAARAPAALGGVAVLVPLIDVLTMIPISISGIGIREWSFVQLFPLLGMSPEAALGVALIASSLLMLRNLSGAFLIPGVPASLRRPQT